MRRKRIIVLLIIIISSIPFLYPLLEPGFFNAHDSESNLFRAAELYNNLDGFTYVRWYRNFSGGYGYPFLNFYAPLTYYIMVIIKFIGLSWINTAKIFLIFTTCLRGFGMYRFCRNFFPRNAAVLSAVGYIYVPYYICNIYVRGDFSEALGFSLIPLVLHMFYKLIQTKKPAYIILSALTLASIIFSHNGIALIFMPLLIFFILWFAVQSRQIMGFFKSVLSLILGLGMSSFFWLPSIIEKKYVHIERTIEGKFQYFNNFLGWKELLSRQWGFGTSPNDPMPLGLGWIHIAIFTIALIYLLIPKQKAKSSILFFIIITALTTFMIFPASTFIWSSFPLLKFLQFPWRLLAIAGFSSSVVFGILSYLKLNTKWIFLIGIVTVFFYSQYCITNGTYEMPDSKLTPQAIREQKITTAYSDEYRPLWAKKDLMSNPPLCTITKGKAKITKEGKDYINIFCETPCEIIINTFWFPGWNALMDTEPLPIKIQNPTGLIQLDLPAGSHKIKLRFINTPIRKIAKTISLLSLIIVLFLSISFRRKALFWSAFGVVSGFWFLSSASTTASTQYIPDPYDSQGEGVFYITEIHNTGSLCIKAKEKKNIFIISSHKLHRAGLFIKNNGKETTRVSINKNKLSIAPQEIQTLWMSCKGPLYNVKYFYELTIKNGNSPIFLYITTDPYKLALLCIEKLKFEDAIYLLKNITKNNPNSIEPLLSLASSYFYSGKAEKAKELFTKIENMPEYNIYMGNKEPIKTKNLTLTLTPWDLLQETGALIPEGAFYNKSCHKPGSLIYGPYKRFPRGIYEVTYWIKASDFNKNSIIAKLDIHSEGYTIKERFIKGNEFQEPDKFYPFKMKFYNPDSTKELEFRVAVRGTANIIVKQIDIEPDLYDTKKELQKDLHLAWGKMYIEEKNFTKAYEKISLAVNLCPHDLSANLLLANILYKLSQYKEASIQYEKILKLVPEHEELLTKLLELYILLNQPENTSLIAQRISELTPQISVGINFSNLIEFKGYSIEPISKQLKITYYWKIHTPECRSYVAFVHFRYNNKIIFQHDHYLAEYNPSAPKWKPGEIIKEEYMINIPDNIPTGKYKIFIGLLKPPDLCRRLKTLSGKTEIEAGTVNL